jgi:hypothetical protein
LENFGTFTCQTFIGPYSRLTQPTFESSMSEITHITNSAVPEGTSKFKNQDRFNTRCSRSQSLPSIKVTKKTNSPSSPILGFFQSFTLQTRPSRRSSFVSEYENGEKTNPLFASGSEDTQDTGQDSKLSNSSFEDFQKLKQINFLKNEGKKKLEVNLKKMLTKKEFTEI